MSLGTKRTNLLTFGYIRDAQSILPNFDNPYYNIPKDVANLTLSYIHNYFRNHGQYQWQINDIELIQSLIDYDVGQAVESKEFEMTKMLWRIQIYPNGDIPDRKGIFVIALKPLSIDSIWDKMIFCRNIEFLEDNYNHIMISSKSDGDTSAGWHRTFKLSNLSQHSTVTIKVTVNILSIILKSPMNTISQQQNKTDIGCPKTQRFCYKIDEALLNILKRKPNNFCHYSSIFEGMWCLDFYVNGDSGNDGYTAIFLRQCFCFSVIKANYTIICEETGDKIKHWDTTFSQNDQSWGESNWFATSKLTDMKSLTLSAMIEIQDIQETQNLNDISDEVQISNMLLASKQSI